MIDNPQPYYLVNVTVQALDGSFLVWSIERDPTEPPPAPGYGLADPLRVSVGLPNSDALYVQPDPFSGSFNLIVADLAEVSKLEEKSPVRIMVWAWDPSDLDLDPYTGQPYRPIVAVHGTVADVSSRPHPLGSVVTVNWVDHTVSENERDVGTIDWPAETANIRVARIADQLGIADINAGQVPPVALTARPASATPGRSYLVHVLDQAANSIDVNGWWPDYFSRAYVGAAYSTITQLLPDPDRIQVTTLASRIFRTPGTLPAVLGDVGGGVYGVVIAPLPPTGVGAEVARVLSADHVERDGVSYRLSKAERPDTYTIKGQFPGGVAQVIVQEDGALPIRATLDTDLTSVTDAQALGGLNLNGRASDGWAANKFHWHADLDPLKLLHPTPVFHDDRTLVAFLQFDPVVIDGVKPEQNPSGESWYAGQITGLEFVLAAGRYSVDVTTRRNLPIPLPVVPPQVLVNGDYLAPSKMTGPLAAVAPEDLDPRMTAFDARLLRSDF